MNVLIATISAFIISFVVLCDHTVASINRDAIYGNIELPTRGTDQTDIENETVNSPTCKLCAIDDIGLKYICQSFTSDVDGCMMYTLNNLHKAYKSGSNAGSFRRTRKQFSVNGALSSIASMLNGEQTRSRDQLLRSRIQSMG